MRTAGNRSDEIVTAFANALFARQYQDRDGEVFEVRGDCLSGPITTGREDGPEVEIDLSDLLAPRIADGPARCERKRAPR
jgi:hypothetical protein